MKFHTNEPEYDINFYKQQNSMMKQRYSSLFKSREISWDKYLRNASYKLSNNIYYMWIFLCGLDTFLKQNNNLEFEQKTSLIKSLYKDANDRIYRILGDDKENQDYINSL